MPREVQYMLNPHRQCLYQPASLPTTVRGDQQQHGARHQEVLGAKSCSARGSGCFSACFPTGRGERSLFPSPHTADGRGTALTQGPAVRPGGDSSAMALPTPPNTAWFWKVRNTTAEAADPAFVSQRREIFPTSGFGTSYSLLLLSPVLPMQITAR